MIPKVEAATDANSGRGMVPDCKIKKRADASRKPRNEINAKVRQPTLKLTDGLKRSGKRVREVAIRVTRSRS